MKGGVEFDQIAPIYDDTRRPPSDEEVQALLESLAGSRTLLEAGVGTGRFAVPLRAHDLRVVGIDLSRAMMKRARQKGIEDLVRANVLRLPIRTRSIDAAYMVHVLQLLPDPRPALAELGRVARQAVVVLLPEWSSADRSTGSGSGRRDRYRAIAAELGYPLPDRGKRYRHTFEEISAIAPPRSVRVILQQRPEGTSPEEWRERRAVRAARMAQLPPEVHAEIVQRLQAEMPVDASDWDRARTERILAWDPASLVSPVQT
jgi:ubiquinone/menaquinone biosynthesis C-methylase UbiE